VSRAVAASSAVPVLFAPVLIKRNDDCDYKKPGWLSDAELQAQQTGDLRLQEAADSLNYYLDKKNPPYATLLDGGVTDNLGLRTILRSVSLSGGIKKMYGNMNKSGIPPRQMVVIVVNASTTTDTSIGDSRRLPPIREVLAAVTDIQLHLYNTETNSLLKQQLMEWADDLSTENHVVEPYFIDIDVSDIKDPQERIYFNKIPTSFSLEKDQADHLVKLARRMLQENPEYRRLLQTLGAHGSSTAAIQ
jgi:NTE family protein